MIEDTSTSLYCIYSIKYWRYNSFHSFLIPSKITIMMMRWCRQHLYASNIRLAVYKNMLNTAYTLNSLTSEQNGCHFADDILFFSWTEIGLLIKILSVIIPGIITDKILINNPISITITKHCLSQRLTQNVRQSVKLTNEKYSFIIWNKM